MNVGNASRNGNRPLKSAAKSTNVIARDEALIACLVHPKNLSTAWKCSYHSQTADPHTLI